MFDKIKSEMDRIEAEHTAGELTTRKAIHALTSLSDMIEEVSVSFADTGVESFSVGDYGSGRTYYPFGHEDWDEEYADDYGSGHGHGYWLSSSDMC